ncbi:MAG: hypothetical protein ISP90_04460 [Nevskia sp.]|nr:hypothetical protein [Nevskia sp.]
MSADDERTVVIVRIREPQIQYPLGEFAVKSKSQTAMESARGVIEDHAEKIVNYLQSVGS